MTPRYVSFPARAGAWAIDKLLLFGLAALMARLYPVDGLSLETLTRCVPDPGCLAQTWRQFGLAAVRWLIPASLTVMFLTRLRATPGKLLLQAEVVDAKTGTALSTRQAWIRVFACTLSYLTLGLGHLMALIDLRKQTLHDKCAGSVVIHRKKNRT